MVRTVKAKAPRSLNKGASTVLLPGPVLTEPWELWVMAAGETKCLQTCATPMENRLAKKTTLALPVSQVLCIPLWLNETDEKKFSGMIALQLELRGLLPRGNEAVVFDWTAVAVDGTRTLVMAGVLPSSLAEEVQAESYEGFDLSARYQSLPEDALTLWQEQGRIVAAFTRGPSLVYCQALAEGGFTESAMQDLNCMKLALELQGVLLSLQQVMVWMEITPVEVAALRAAWNLPVTPGECPPPKPPAPAWKLVPVSVVEARRKHKTRRWQSTAILIALSIYLLLAAAALVRLYLISTKVNELRQWQTVHSPAIADVRKTRAAWKDLRPVVDEDRYPITLLLYASESIPADQLHLTLFEAKDGHVLIQGEAKNAAAAFAFLDKLKKDIHFAGFTWEMGQPHLLPNDLAQFQIEGTL